MGNRALNRHRKEQAAAEQDQAAWDDPAAVAVSAYCAFPSLDDGDGIARARILTERKVRDRAAGSGISGVRWHTIPALPAGGVRRVLDAAVGVDRAEIDGLLAFCGRNPAGGLVVASILVDPAAAGPLAQAVAAELRDDTGGTDE
jgi:hypothetical protein